MKKAKLFLDKFFITDLVKFLSIQSLFIITIFFYGDGGHGTYIPFAIFYGLFSILFFIHSSIFTFFLGPICFFLITIYILLKGSKANFKIFLSVHIFSVIIALFLALPENITITLQSKSIIISCVLSFLFWILFYIVLKNKGRKCKRTNSF